MSTENKLPDGDPEQDIKHLKRLSIYLESDSLIPARKLRINILGYTAADRDESGGTVVSPGKWPVTQIDEFLAAPSLGMDAVLPASQLDFPIQAKCFVTLKLVGDFWQFSNIRDPITTKEKHADYRYYGLRTHRIGGRMAAFSFCARKPQPEQDNGSYIRHGINLYIDFLQDTFQLPVIVDPDIENKGGNPGT
ncbi:MAG TPA: nucleotide synthetase [Allosphingosinicella sp.]|jgi:hypothetical protein|nr:nucleotide synthetase [Allosphingosinicella sp.]